MALATPEDQQWQMALQIGQQPLPLPAGIEPEDRVVVRIVLEIGRELGQGGLNQHLLFSPVLLVP